MIQRVFAKNLNANLEKARTTDLHNDLGQSEIMYAVLAQAIFEMTLAENLTLAKNAPQALSAALAKGATLASTNTTIFAENPEKERGRRLQRELQSLRPMQPLIFSNVYQAPGNETNTTPEVFSVGKLHGGAQNLVLLHSRFRGDSWWTKQEFLDLSYRKRLWDLLWFFVVFLLLVFSPLCLYAYFAGRYARDFFRVQEYIAQLPFVGLAYKGRKIRFVSLGGGTHNPNGKHRNPYQGRDSCEECDSCEEYDPCEGSKSCNPSVGNAGCCEHVGAAHCRETQAKPAKIAGSGRLLARAIEYRRADRAAQPQGHEPDLCV